MKKQIAFILLFSVFLGFFRTDCFSENICISAQSAVLYDPLTETLLFEKNASQRLGMASTTKIMTALIAIEQYDLSDVITIRKEWCDVEGSSIYLIPGEQITVEALLYGLLLESGNDAAMALAGYDPGGCSEFICRMNKKAVEFGLLNTHYENPSGLDGREHYTTAVDLAKLAAAAMKDPVFAKIAGTRSISIAGRKMQNHNHLLNEVGFCGVKTGYTKNCGRCLVSAKEQNGRMLICVTLNDRDDWNDHEKLYCLGFSQYRQYDLIGTGDCGSVPLFSASKKTSRLYINESFSFFTRNGEESLIKTQLIGPRFCYGGICAGECYGKLQIRLDRTVIFETPVYYGDSAVADREEMTFWQRFTNLFSKEKKH